MLTAKERKAAYQMWLNHEAFSRIARRFRVPQGTMIRLIMEEHRRQSARCRTCRWRRDGRQVCLLPRCLRQAERTGW